MDLKKVSKRLSYVLRHRPDSVGLTLDEAGWVPVEKLLKALRISRSQLDEVVAGNDKQRFIIEGDRIRANQGHSVDVDLRLEPIAPPDRLYHGTVARYLDSIREQGLLRGSRHHVHLSADPETAAKVGARRGRPVILKVDSKAMAAAGHVFYRSANGVWLTDSVPPSFLVLPGTGEASSSR
ncbi:MAG TPA: RNA 2'-phosphotransferase [Candidatus Limnocylindrales bacterium]|nr:RNA 2'-phosphotransferase [Candidatus Limnocylindrales bacterium]